MLCGSVAFALMAILAESLKETFTFPWISMVRSGVATILAFALAWSAGAKFVVWKPSTLWWRSISGWMAMMFGFYAMTHFDVEIVLALTNSYPIWVAVLSWPLLGLIPSRRVWLALSMSCAGMGMIYLSNVQSSRLIGPFSHPQTAIPSAIIASVLSGVALVNLHRLKDIDSRAIVTHFSAVATLGSFLVWLTLPVPLELKPHARLDLVGLISIGVAATVGQLCLTKAFSSGSPASVSVVGLSQVLVAALFKWFTASQTPGPVSLIGMLLVLASTVWIILAEEK
jgi:drug/metabolite transporter (DMT)-like permease